MTAHKNGLWIFLCKLILSTSLSAFTQPAQTQETNAKSPPVRCKSISELVCQEFSNLGKGINFGMAIDGLNLGRGLSQKERVALARARDKFDSFRILISWPDFASLDESGVVAESFATQVDELIDFMTARGGILILSMHRYNQLTGDPLRKEQKLVEQSILEQRFINIWVNIFSRYARKHDRLIFELYNEPHGRLNPEAWNTLVSRTISEVRKIDADRIIMIDSPFWANASHLKFLSLPQDNRIIATVHSYFPFEFTHQGADWGSPRYPKGVTCCSDIQRAVILANLKVAAQWSEKTGYPVYVGEFGSIEYADRASRLNYIESSREIMSTLGLPWAYWEMGRGFSIFSMEEGRWERDLLDALLK